jgi:hypothetical protein
MACGRESIYIDKAFETDLPDEELRKFVAHQQTCPDVKCPSAGFPQDLKLPRIVQV